MLILLFQLGNDRYALEASRVVEVVPLLGLTKIPQAPKGVAGIFVYRGRAVPAIDLCELMIGHPARERLSTRIIVVEIERPDSQAQGRSATHLSPLAEPYRGEQGAGSREQGVPPPCPLLPASGQPSLLGIIVERATGTMRREARDFVEMAEKAGSRVQGAGTPCSVPPAPGFLGPVLVDDTGVIQLLHAQKLLGLWNSSPRGIPCRSDSSADKPIPRGETPLGARSRVVDSGEVTGGRKAEMEKAES